jgi:hypothetical protein
MITDLLENTYSKLHVESHSTKWLQIYFNNVKHFVAVFKLNL